MKRKKGKDYLRLRDGVSNTDLGRLVAEDDGDLDRYYVSPERYVERALDAADSAVFFIGPKGAGKSAVLQMVRIRKRTENDRIINVSPDDLAFVALANIQASTPILADAAKNQWLFKCLWDYILALEVYKREFREEGSLVRFFSRIAQGDHTREARKLLEISLGNGSATTLSQRILQLIKEVELGAEHSGSKLTENAATVAGGMRPVPTRCARRLLAMLAGHFYPSLRIRGGPPQQAGRKCVGTVSTRSTLRSSTGCTRTGPRW